MSPLRTVLLVVALLSGGSALAGDQQSVALHPSEVVDADEALAARVHALVAAELRRQGTTLVPPEKVARALTELAKGGCSALSDEERTACLSGLAKRTTASRAILFSIAPFAGDRVILTTQIVSPSGVVLQALPPLSHPRPSRHDPEPAVREALRELVPRLELRHYLAHDLLTPLAPASPSPILSEGARTSAAADLSTTSAAPTTPATPSGSSSFQRTAGWVSLGAGAALLAGGTFGLVDAHQKADQFNAHYRDGARPASSVDGELSQLRHRSERNQTLGVLGVGLGAAVVACGAYLALAAPSPGGSATWSLQLGPAHAGLVVRFR